MAPVEDLFKRYWVCPSGYSYHDGRCYRSRWYSWGRWVVLAIAISLFLIVFFSCLTIACRRRRRGVRPMYGTGWMAPQGKWGNPPQNNPQGYQNYPPPGGGFQQQQRYGGYPPAPPPPGGGFQQQQRYGGYPPAPPPLAYGQQQQPQYTGITFRSEIEEQSGNGLGNRRDMEPETAEVQGNSRSLNAELDAQQRSPPVQANFTMFAEQDSRRLGTTAQVAELPAQYSSTRVAEADSRLLH
ncbi:chitin synthesis regulation, resistance to congo red-domain-containing protein [Thelonectria olida]|uniref:Chitin synthesis regulation, resistance to congo red-domain-containing protein n=1 Tax=Thelonectria olida TaxID=1576542 RepID=A0A9P8VQ96_9HYPO|nr:chitin synthesis regulation, resistance to congo red-domain-containing protein [Thelonectria olida]